MAQEYVAQYIILTLLQYGRTQSMVLCNWMAQSLNWYDAQLLRGCFLIQRGTVIEKKVGTEKR